MNTAIEIQSLSFQYPDGRKALHEVSLTIPHGQKLALVGANGAGKSTLLLHLNGILVGQGSVRISELALTKENLSNVRARVGMVFQNPDDQLFSPTVYEDVAYGPMYQGLPAAEIDRRVEEALSLVNMQGYQNRSAFHLSMGEKKRIAIATVLSMRPDILVMDEPSAGLDPRARRSLIELLANIPQTLIVATHDLDLAARIMERTVVLQSGWVVFDGPTADILSDEQRLITFGL